MSRLRPCRQIRPPPGAARLVNEPIPQDGSVEEVWRNVILEGHMVMRVKLLVP